MQDYVMYYDRDRATAKAIEMIVNFRQKIFWHEIEAIIALNRTTPPLRGDNSIHLTIPKCVTRSQARYPTLAKAVIEEDGCYVDLINISINIHRYANFFFLRKTVWEETARSIWLELLIEMNAGKMIGTIHQTIVP
jgi:hypothetical protein